MSDTTKAPIHEWLAESIDASVRRAIDRTADWDDVQHVAVMPDVHLAGDLCVGMAIATTRLLYPAAIGGDIGCGMLTLAFDVEAASLRDGDAGAARAGRVLHALGRAVPGSRRHRSRRLPMPSNLKATKLSHSHLDAIARDEGSLQLGTLGGGNHFVELQADEADDRLWLMIHTGSRAMGQAVRHQHVAVALAARPGEMPSLDASAEAGQAYLHDAAWASAYAEANRQAIAEGIIETLHEVIGAAPIESTQISIDHNHVRREQHFGQDWFVHRKGAMPADADLTGVVPGSMGTLSYHVEGRGCPESLRSSAHGAGRRFSRAAARERFSAVDVKHQLRHVWFDPRQTHTLREEAPHAYKDVRSVLRAQEALVRVTRTLRPVLSYKAG
ncbi:MAG: RtcB family protein [Tepidisphaeraceae bacterium]